MNVESWTVHIYASMHTYIHACVHGYIHTHMHACIRTYMHMEGIRGCSWRTGRRDYAGESMGMANSHLLGSQRAWK